MPKITKSFEEDFYGKTTKAQNELLIYRRKVEMKLTQSDIEAHFQFVGKDVTRQTVIRWENDGIIPHPDHLQELYKFLKREPKQLGYPEVAPSFWSMTHKQNLFFTGRETIINELLMVPTLRDSRTPRQKKPIPLRPQALCGLGGIGKTEIAIEYIYRYSELYHTIVWLHAQEPTVLASDFAAIATMLDLPGLAWENNQETLINAVLKWLDHPIITKWLLVFDNVNDLATIAKYIPQQCHGHIIITTQNQITIGDYADKIAVEPMEAKEGAKLILTRAEIKVPTPTQKAEAQKLSETLGGLPLVLSQAGAYIVRRGRDIAGYHKLYQERHAVLHREPEPTLVDKEQYPYTVDTTWSLAFNRVQEANPSAAELLNFFAFLNPDNIYEEIITENSSRLGELLQPLIINPIALDKAIEELRTYSLIDVDHTAETRSFRLHRLVQIVIKDKMREDNQRAWANRTVEAVNYIFPDGTVEALALCEKYLPQATTCAKLIEHWKIVTQEAGRLLTEMGAHLSELGRYKEAEPYFKNALTIRQQIFNPEHPDLLESRSNLAALYNYIGMYEKAESLLVEILTILEQAPEPDENQLALTLKSFGFFHLSQGNYAKAILYYHRASDIRVKLFGWEHPSVASGFNDLAVAYRELEAYEQAMHFQEQALNIYKSTYGSEHPEIARCLNNMAAQYRNMGEYEQAEPLYIQALHMRKKTLGLEHPDVANSLHGLGELYRREKKYKEAEQFLTDALAMREKLLGSNHIDTAFTLNSLAQTYDALDKYAQAEFYYKRALTIREQIMGQEHPQTIAVMECYASFLRKTGRKAQARELERHFQVAPEEHGETATQ